MILGATHLPRSAIKYGRNQEFEIGNLLMFCPIQSQGHSTDYFGKLSPWNAFNPL